MAGFKYEDCSLKHFVRVKGWLPRCKARKIAINKGKKLSSQRRLRYFTFCAVNAIDVLMLDVAKVLRPSRSSHRFDTVVFFDRTPENVTDTERRIPGAIGFVGDFTDVVLARGPGTRDELDPVAQENAIPTDEENTFEVRERQRMVTVHNHFKRKFPFDVINLDLEEFPFKERDEFPGKVVLALRKIFAWQTQAGAVDEGGRKRALQVDSFTLMFTTRLAPPDALRDDYRDMLRQYMDENVARIPELLSRLRSRGIEALDVSTLERAFYDEYYKLALRKILLQCLMENDWYIDDNIGIQTYSFERCVEAGSYTMIHFVMEVLRQDPPYPKRANLKPAPQADEAYARVVQQIFSVPDIIVTEEIAAATTLEPTLAEIAARRTAYLGHAIPK